MAASRLPHARDAAGLVLPDAGPVAWFGAPGDADFALVEAGRITAIQPFAPAASALQARGATVTPRPEGRFAAAIVTLPRARDRAQDWLAEAAARTDGPVVIDGAKTDGVDAILKAVRGRVTLSGQVAKNHGKLFWFDGTDAFDDWRKSPAPNGDGFVTAPGVFSADGIDPASRALADALPAKLGARVADLGAGWGYLATRILEREGVAQLHLVEADRTALDCAEANVTDPRVAFHWADATSWRAPDRLDAVVMNPPFHVGRAADPALGRAFIAAAARALAPHGALWMVANRHLPYEATLAETFRDVAEAGGDRRVKILHAARPIGPSARRA
ncbi:methyltransferase [Roseivivax marinus]|uniref:Methyltransferase n=1 Tax=Roseivivax marinus TaxID=1379903 RepID=W4HGR9_9RHOB|nr:class I SAM-dependent methyltransferase [Roseivivax marinus]ETW11351.1 methyltransferase [Roseivivax marinus]